MTPSWLDRTEYPFAPHWVDVEGGRIHYVDEGSGGHAPPEERPPSVLPIIT